MQGNTLATLHQRPDEIKFRGKKITSCTLRLPLGSEQVIRTQPDERTTAPINTSQKYDRNTHTQTKLHQSNTLLESRLLWIDQLANSLKMDKPSLEIGKVLGTLQEIGKTLNTASKTEIELNQRLKQLDYTNLETIHQKQTIMKLKDQSNYYKQGNDEYVKKINSSQNELQRLQRDLTMQKRLNDDYYKKIKSYERRIEIMLEKNCNQDQLRGTLTDLIKENEELKRDLQKREKEIERLKELNSKLIVQNTKINKKLDSLKTKKIGTQISDTERKEEPKQSSNFAFDPNQLPMDLAFRLSQLSSDHNDLLLDLLEHGPEVFTNQLLGMETIPQKKELINLVSNQFISSRDFAEKINQIMSEFVTMISYKQLSHLLTHISRAFQHIFNSDIIHLWVIEGMTCRAQTYDANGKKIQALLTDGAFSKLIFEDYGIRSPSKQSELLYITEKGQVYGSNFLLLPIMNEMKKPLGILEIQNINEESILDSQYYGLLINMLSKSVLNNIIDTEALYKELKYHDFFQLGFLKLTKCNTQQSFGQGVQELAMQIFHISQTRVWFIQNYHFVRNEQQYSIYAGCAGYALRRGKAEIITEISKHQNFDENVDISTILPVFIAPIYVNEVAKAVIEILIKKKYMGDKHPFGNQSDIGFKVDPIELDVNKFYQTVQAAYQFAFPGI